MMDIAFEGASLDVQQDKYAELLVRKAANLQQDQELVLSAPIQAAGFARKVARAAYDAGARHVTVIWGDDEMGRIIYDGSPIDYFETYPQWAADRMNQMANEGAAFLMLTGSDPEALKGVDPRKPALSRKAAHESMKDYRRALDFGRNVWVIAGVPTPAWATTVFPDADEDEAVLKLWNAILKTARADGDDPIKSWSDHKETFDARKEFLNAERFDRLHITSANGTDLTVGMTGKHTWSGGGAETVDGRYFFPNVPTEEVFTSPDYRRTEGIVYSAMPLVYQGTIIDDFWFRFEDGSVVEFDAAQGKEVLQELLDTDDGARRLGEVALIPKTSPIRQTGILFYSTLYDENASCHIALGLGFPDCYEGGLDMDEDSLFAEGVNKSVTHVDFMIGADDLQIDGYTSDDEKTTIFRDGVWAPELNLG